MIEDYIKTLKYLSDDSNLYWYEYQSNSLELKVAYSFSTSIIKNGEKIESWGTDHCKEKAILKSVMELLERVILSQYTPTKIYNKKGFFDRRVCLDIWSLTKKYGSNGWLNCTTSSGVAVHTSKKKASQNAISELIERHVIIKAFAQKISPHKVQDLNFLKDYKIPKDINLSFYQWKGPLGHHVILCQITKNNRNLFAYGCSKCLKSALDKAFYEASSKVIYLTQMKDNSYQSLRSNKLTNYYEHNDAHDALDFLKDNSKENLVDVNFRKKDLYLAHYDLSFLSIPQKTLYCVRAFSPMLQSMFKGNWKNNIINHRTIKINENSYPTHPHFYN